MKKSLVLLLSAIALISSCNMAPQAIVEQQTILINKQCPLQVGNGMTLTKMENDPRYVMYYYEGDSNLYRFNKELVTETLKNQVLNEIISQSAKDAASMKFINALIELDKGIIYHYYTSSGTVMDVVIEAKQIYSALNSCSEPVDIDVWANSENNIN